MQSLLQSIHDFVGAINEWIIALPDYQAFLLFVGGAIITSILVQIGGDIVLRRLTRRIPGDVDDIFFGYVHLSLWVTILIGGIALGLERLDQLGQATYFVHSLSLSIIVLTWTYALIRIGPPVLTAVTETSYVDNHVLPIFQNVWTVIVIGGSIFSIFSIWGIDVTPLLASAGLLGIVVGLAARDTLANFFGSIALYADGTYSVGDYIVLESGERGRVEDVTIRSTVIRTRDDIFVTVPNSALNNAAVINESAPRSHRRLKIPVSIAYGTDIDKVEEMMLEIVAESDLVREHPNPRVRLREFGESGLNIELMCWIDDPRLRGKVTDLLMREIYNTFREADIEIPYPQHEVRMRQTGTSSPVEAEGTDN